MAYRMQIAARGGVPRARNALSEGSQTPSAETDTAMSHPGGQERSTGPGAEQATAVRSGDTEPLPPGDSTRAGESAKAGTGFDTFVGRLVIEQGLATEEEVQHCLERAKASSGPDLSQKTLSDLLVDHDYVTKRQMQRLRQQAEAERSSQKIPGYKIYAKLGAGAMATVFKAKQVSLDRLVAIKVLPRKYSDNPQFIERFYAEGRAAAQLNHPNIVQAYDVGRAGEYHFFVMEFVDGRTVYDDIIKHKRFTEREALDVIIQIAEALEHAHQKGLIHRDVKPKNLMITPEGVAKLADMGLARAISDKEAAEAESGKAFGTPYYISPEQIRGEREIGPPADIYSLGATLYHMVTGSVPFEGKNPSSVMHRHLKAALVPPDHVNPKLSAGTSEVIEMMMAKNPAKRYRNCADLLVDLRAARDGKSPPLAHRDMLGADTLTELAQAEAAAVADEVPVDQSGGERVPAWVTPVIALLAVAALGSIILNVVQAVAM